MRARQESCSRSHVEYTTIALHLHPNCHFSGEACERYYIEANHGFHGLRLGVHHVFPNPVASIIDK